MLQSFSGAEFLLVDGAFSSAGSLVLCAEVFDEASLHTQSAKPVAVLAEQRLMVHSLVCPVGRIIQAASEEPQPRVSSKRGVVRVSLLLAQSDVVWNALSCMSQKLLGGRQLVAQAPGTGYDTWHTVQRQPD